MYRIVASDMDGTLLGEDHLMPQANVRAIARLRELGVLFVPTSGRNYPSLMDGFAEMADLLEGSYVISFNGGCVNRVGDPTPLACHTMEHEKAQQLLSYAEGLEVGIHVYLAAGEIWCSNLPQEERDWLDGLQDYEDFEGTDIGFLADKPIAKVLYMSTDFSYLHEVERQMRDVSAGCEVSFSSGRYLEFNPAGVNKAAGVRELCQIVGTDIADVICMGDAANDASMIAAAGLGVAVANAEKDIKELADVVLDARAEDGALAEVARRFF